MGRRGNFPWFDSDTYSRSFNDESSSCLMSAFFILAFKVLPTFISLPLPHLWRAERFFSGCGHKSRGFPPQPQVVISACSQAIGWWLQTPELTAVELGPQNQPFSSRVCSLASKLCSSTAKLCPILLLSFLQSIKRSSAMATTIEASAPTESINVEPTKEPIKRVNTLGTVRHRHEHTNEVLLVPTPSADPNDPLNWYDLLSVF